MDVYDLPFLRKSANNSYIYRFVAPLQHNTPVICVTRFSRYTDIDNVWLGVGTEFGCVAFEKADSFQENFDKLHQIRLTEHAITDLHFMCDQEHALALNMIGSVYLVDIERGVIRRRIISQDENHVSFAGQYNDPHCYVVSDKVTGGLKYMDLRRYGDMAVASARPRSVLTPSRRNATTPRRGQAKSPRRPGTPTTPSSKGKGVPVVDATPTCIKHIGEKMFAVGYTKAQKGIQVWDMRYAKIDSPCYTLKVPADRRSNFGVASLSLKNDNSTLFALCTDGGIREYDISSVMSCSPRKPVDEPRNMYKGAIRGDFQVEFGVSPFTDHIVCGTDEGAGIWDLKDSRKYAPKYGLKYISNQMASCDWSANGRFIVGMTVSDVDSMVVLYDNDSDISRSIQTEVYCRLMSVPGSPERVKYVFSKDVTIKQYCEKTNKLARIQKEHSLQQSVIEDEDIICLDPPGPSQTFKNRKLAKLNESFRGRRKSSAKPDNLQLSMDNFVVKKPSRVTFSFARSVTVKNYVESTNKLARVTVRKETMRNVEELRAAPFEGLLNNSKMDQSVAEEDEEDVVVQKGRKKRQKKEATVRLPPTDGFVMASGKPRIVREFRNVLSSDTEYI
ncbi:unnamed protein product [Bursaphelenchus okinawaensis]|uniref:WD_REPEATS_REGION domain-containing protein n=1 Tax=Bursaphelenchus okinawaensis TaxID=465554 RepID=A0A811L9C5_9BILA|nr:unnamed protein product [Bursaphelenchus okinawaensis]CAG9119758.1 unnamed protein product [Bursaphelenchus okinawaensis]